MAKYIKKPVVVEAITFDELVEYGINQTVLHGLAWSFDYLGHMVSQENIDCFLITTSLGTTERFKRGEMLITYFSAIHILPMDTFKKYYEPAEQTQKMDVNQAIASIALKRPSYGNYLGEFLDSFNKQVAEKTEKLLQEYRDKCVSDEEFSEVMNIIIDPGQPLEITQYYFRGAPVFYTEFALVGIKLSVKILEGYWKNVRFKNDHSKKIQNEVM